MTILLLVSLTYFFYNFYFFPYVSIVMDMPRVKTRYILVTFVINYAVFILCTIIELHLIINWYIFFICLFVEVSLLCRGDRQRNIMVALSGVLVGLALNLFFRNVTAIIMKVPLSAFDNNFSLPGNAKQYPIALGFLCAGLWLFTVTHQQKNMKMQVVLKDKKSLKFFLILVLTMYGYLCLNLLVYYAPGDYLVLKLWELKASAVVMIGYYLALSFSYRMSRLEQFRAENYQAKLNLEMGKREEERLYSIAYQDQLTGCGTRQHAVDVLAEALEKGERFCLCFIDLNGLKTVNDELGHSFGDQYLYTVAQILRSHFRKHSDRLFRYGGDEFILMVYQTDSLDVRERMAEVGAELSASSESLKNPYRMSVSFGLVNSTDYHDVDEMITEADRRMYEYKKKMKKE